jgi:Arc/MetJ family transcription regulator
MSDSVFITVGTAHCSHWQLKWLQALATLQLKERNIRSLIQSQRGALEVVQTFKNMQRQQLATDDDAVDEVIRNVRTGTCTDSVSEADAAAIQALLDADEQQSDGKLAAESAKLLNNRSVTCGLCNYLTDLRSQVFIDLHRAFAVPSVYIHTLRYKHYVIRYWTLRNCSALRSVSQYMHPQCVHTDKHVCILRLHRKKVTEAKGGPKGALAGNNSSRYSTYNGATKNTRLRHGG